MFLAGAAPNVSVVAPAPTCSASARAFAASRLITSTVCPALAARPPIAAATIPEPMMLIVLMCVLLVSSNDVQLPVAAVKVEAAHRITHIVWRARSRDRLGGP